MADFVRHTLMISELEHDPEEKQRHEKHHGVKTVIEGFAV